jgi:manganese/zinc/iron transport system substrate-binding protein
VHNGQVTQVNSNHELETQGAFNMNQTYTKVVLILLLAAGLTVSAVAQPTANPGKLERLTARTSTGPVNVVTTTNFITDLVEQIGGKNIKVTGLMGPGVDPHLYKATAGDVRALQRAELVFYGGLDLEGKMVELLERIPRAIAVTERIPREQLRKPGTFMPSSMRVDPHVWFNVKLWSQTIGVVRDALSKLDPVNASMYAARATAYSKRLEQLESFVRRETARVPKAQRVLVTAHDAFGYFGDAYGFEVRGVQGMSTVSEAGARDVQALAEFLVSRKIRAVFVESSVPKRTVEAVVAAAQAKGWNVRVGGSLFSDAAGQRGTPEGTYVGMVEANVKTIVTALLGE